MKKGEARTGGKAAMSDSMFTARHSHASHQAAKPRPSFRRLAAAAQLQADKAEAHACPFNLMWVFVELDQRADPAAVNLNRCARDVAGALGDEKRSERGELARLSEAAHRDLLFPL